MYPVSDAFLAEIRRSHRVVSYIDVSPPGTYPDTVGPTTMRLRVTDGSVKVDRTAATRRTISCTVMDEDGTLTPTSAKSLLAPFGTQLRAYRGVEFTTGVLKGTTEVVPLGVFRISKATVKDTNGGPVEIDLEGYDLSRTMSRDQFIAPYTVDQGANVIDAAKALVLISFPDMQFDAITSTVTLNAPLTFDAQNDPWAKANDPLAAAAGAEMFFDQVGRCVIAQPPDISNLPAPVWTFIEGEGCTAIELDDVFSDDPGYNGVVLTTDSGGDDTTPIRSVVWDDDETSPTYYLGPYGDVPYFMQNTAITTQADADAAALAQLNQILGVTLSITVTALVNPALDVEDTVEVIRQRTGLSGKFAIDSIDIPLSGSATQTLNLRQKRVT